MATDFGSDLSCLDDLDPLGTVVSGAEMVKQRAVRRLMSRKGSILSAPFAETVDLRDLLSDSVAPGGAAKIQALVRAALLDDECVSDVSVQVTFIPTTRHMLVAVGATGSQGPFAFTLNVSAVTVSILAQ